MVSSLRENLHCCLRIGKDGEVGINWNGESDDAAVRVGGLNG